MAGKDDTQTMLLKEILAELRRLNANLEKWQPAQADPHEIKDAMDAEEDDSEELEYFE